MMTQNTLTASANTAGSLFQIFNLPKAGNSSYLFSDIIKIVGDETETPADTFLNLSNTVLVPESTQVETNFVDSSKLINLLLQNIKGEQVNAASSENSNAAGEYFINENELEDFFNLLGFEKASAIAKKSSEITIEISPEFLNKLSILTNQPVKQHAKSLFVSLDSSETANIEMDNSNEPNIEENGKIKIIFKKVENNQETPITSDNYSAVFNYQGAKPLEESVVSEVKTEITSGETDDPVLSAEKKILFAGKPQVKEQTINIKGGQVKADVEKPVLTESEKALKTEFKNLANAEILNSTPEKQQAKNKIQIENKPLVETKNSSIGGTESPKIVETGNVKIVETPAIKNVETGNTKNVENETTKIVETKNAKVIETETTKIAETKNTKIVETEVINKNIAKNAVNKEPLAKVTTDLPGIAGEDIEETEPQTIQKALIKEETVEAGGKTKVNVNDSHIKLTIKPLPEKETPELKENTVTLLSKQAKTVESQTVENEILTGKNAKVLEKIINKPLPSPELNVKEEVNSTEKVTKSSNLYQVSFEKAEPKYSINKEKILPQNFYTSDYEEFDDGLFTDKFQMSFKEKPVLSKPDEPLNSNNITAGKESTADSKISVKENMNDSQDKPAANNSSADNSFAGNKNNNKPGSEFNLEQIQPRSASSNEPVITTKLDAAAKEHTIFRNIDANDLIDEVKKFVVKGEKSNVVLNLKPEHLGSVKLIVDIKDTILTTRIEVENESVKQVVQNNIETLKQSLQQSGIQLSSVSVSLTQQEQKSSAKPEAKKKGNVVKNDVKIDEEVKTSATKKMGYNTYEYLA